MPQSQGGDHLMINYHVTDELGLTEEAFGDAVRTLENAVRRLDGREVVQVGLLLEVTRGAIQHVMNSAEIDLCCNKPNSELANLEQLRQLVSLFADTAQYLVGPAFGPGAKWPTSPYMPSRH
jgi:hypothetical protein